MPSTDNVDNFVNGCTNSLRMSIINGNSGHSFSDMVTGRPLSLPLSLDNELNFNNIPSQTPPPLGGLLINQLVEYNLACLVSLANAEKESPALPIIADAVEVAGSTINGGPSPFSLNLSAEGPLLHNIQELAKLGSSQMNDQDLLPDVFNGIDTNFGLMIENNILDLINDTSVMNEHTSVSSQFVSDSEKYVGLTNGDILGNGHQNFMLPFPRNNQRVNSLEINFKFGQLGPQPGCFNSPHGFCVTDEDCMVVADTNNHRIQVFNKTGDFLNHFGVAGKIDGQLWYPRKVELLSNGRFVICDRGNERSRLQLFSRMGTFIKKIRLKYVDIVAGMTVTPNGQIVVVDSVQPALYQLTEDGDITFWIDCGPHMKEPSDVAVKNGVSYVCDFKGHSVVIFNEHGQFIKKIGGYGLTDYPNGIDIMSNGNILVGDSHGNKFHICIFSSTGDLICEYECPYIKVSRCCGLKITTEGSIVTIAKNNNHVLVLRGPFL